jgi:hypothetical protein
MLTAHTLTAFAVSVLDNQAPATYKGDRDYPYGGQMLLTHCMLDGHHRLQAAAETASTVRILTFYAPICTERPFRLRLCHGLRKSGRSNRARSVISTDCAPAVMDYDW